MKILIVSHNVLSPSSGMGKTLLSYFSDFDPSELSQIYIHSEVPIDASVCTRYFRFTDTDALFARLPGLRIGRTFGAQEIETDRNSSRTDTGHMGDLYQYGRKRSPFIYLIRNLIWKTAFWNTKLLKNWLADFRPDAVFFAAGDYAFMYDIARRIAEKLEIPMITVCLDDYYCNNTNAGRFLGGAAHAAFMRSVRRAMQRTRLLLVICDAMQARYSEMFSVPCRTLYTGAFRRETEPAPAGRQISYIGNLGHLRHRELLQLGRALKSLALPDGPQVIDVYSAEKRPEILRELTEENGVRFHGMAAPETVPGIMAQSMAVVHVESFDPRETARVKYSVSTKIADSLMNGPPMIAFGPQGIASIDYLQAHHAAFVISDPAALPEVLRRFFADAAVREEILSNARALAEANHRGDVVSGKVRAWLQEVIET